METQNINSIKKVHMLQKLEGALHNVKNFGEFRRIIQQQAELRKKAELSTNHNRSNKKFSHQSPRKQSMRDVSEMLRASNR